MTIYHNAEKVYSGTMLFDEIDGLKRHECYKNDPIISGPTSSLLSSSDFHTSSNVKSMEDQINGLVLYNHCICDPERSETDGLNSNDKSMRSFTIDLVSGDTLCIHKVVNVYSLQRHIMIKLETH